MIAKHRDSDDARPANASHEAATAPHPFLYPIHVVARRTGLSIEVLRAWERRYRVVTPIRDDGGRRLYSDSDIARVALLRRAASAGLRIKDAAARSDEELRAFLREHGEAERRAHPHNRVDTTEALLAECKEAVLALAAPALTRTLLRARVELAVPAYIENLLAPLMAWIGEEWSEGRLRIADEHIAASVVRSLIAQQIETADGAAPTIVITTPTGQSHEIGALFAALSASSIGWHVMYLGPGSPAPEIANAVIRSRARAVGLSIVFPRDDPNVAEQLRILRATLPVDIPVFVGGRGAPSYEAAIASVGALRFDDTKRFTKALSSLAS